MRIIELIEMNNDNYNVWIDEMNDENDNENNEMNNENDRI